MSGAPSPIRPRSPAPTERCSFTMIVEMFYRGSIEYVFDHVDAKIQLLVAEQLLKVPFRPDVLGRYNVWDLYL